MSTAFSCPGISDDKPVSIIVGEFAKHIFMRHVTVFGDFATFFSISAGAAVPAVNGSFCLSLFFLSRNYEY